MIERGENQTTTKRVLSLYPGVRTFMTGYDPSGSGASKILVVSIVYVTQWTNFRVDGQTRVFDISNVINFSEQLDGFAPVFATLSMNYIRRCSSGFVTRLRNIENGSTGIA